MSTRDLLVYWPTEKAVAECIKVDAEAASEAVSLAVHQPMRFERRVIGGDSKQYDVCDEHELLQTFLEPDLSEGRVILPIVGTAGSGKSHIVRWFETQMRRLPGGNRRVVIRIPKGISLKGVLRLLLEHLEGPPYQEFRKELIRAQEALEPEEAAGLLCEMLAHTLTRMFEAARQRLRENPANAEARTCEALCRSDVLPALLRNQYLRDQHFVKAANGGPGVVKRLVEHLTEDVASGIDDERKHLFTDSDLIFGEVDQNALGRAELRAIHMLETHEDRRRLAVKFLNDGLDDAKEQLIRLDPTVADLFDAIRGELLKEDRELVLLVEDFVVLSGLQKQLLQVMIKEAIRDGRQVLCTMRTALAYTPGYLDAATVLTRAGAEYRIPDVPGSDEEILAKVVRQVGAYLNAARLGQSRLERAFESKREDGGDLRSWIPAFQANLEPDALAMLEAFGGSRDRYQLFPFNEDAIHQLAKEGCLDAGRLVYNPRLVIKNVLQRVLKDREVFQEGQFPPADITGQVRNLPSPVVEHVKLRVAREDLTRYLRFLAYWGGCPSGINELGHTDPHVFAAFGLDRKRVAGVGTVPPGKKPGSGGEPPDSGTPEPPQSELHPVEAKWRSILEEWRRGETLSQANATQLRKWVAEALEGYIDLNWEFFRPLEDATLDTWFRYVYIPRATGNEGRSAAESMVALCTETELDSEIESARIHGALMAVIRFHGVHSHKWDFDGADESLPRYTAYLEELSEKARLFVRQRYFRQAWDPLPNLVEGLLIGARILGIDGANRDVHHLLIKAMLEPSPSSVENPSRGETEPDPALMSWNALKGALRQCRSSTERDGRKYLSWRDHLLKLVGARQGRGENVLALDVLRLKPAIERTLDTWTLETVGAAASPAAEFVGFRAMAQDIKRHSVAIERYRQRLKEWSERVHKSLGAEFEKVEVVRELTDTMNVIKDAGMGAGLETGKCLKLIEEFRKTPIKEALAEIGSLTPEASRGAILSVLGSGYESLVPATDELLTKVEEVLSSLEGRITSETQAHGEHPLQEAISLLSGELTETSKLLKRAASYGSA
jgi:hypothetical protein